ncbi:hypothetical protein MY11210_008539 [Beauveria gryllotalpidicola]
MPLAQSQQQNLTVTAADLLADDRQLDQFLTEHDISNLPDVLDLSKTQRLQLARAIRARLYPHSDSPGEQLDANELAERLTDVADYEDLCRQELVEDGGHPVGTKQELLHICAQPKISCKATLGLAER